jgi:hypothetical protein
MLRYKQRKVHRRCSSEEEDEPDDATDAESTGDRAEFLAPESHSAWEEEETEGTEQEEEEEEWEGEREPIPPFDHGKKEELRNELFVGTWAADVHRREPFGLPSLVPPRRRSGERSPPASVGPKAPTK